MVGELRGDCSRRINIQKRLVCKVLEEERIVNRLRPWSYCKSVRRKKAGGGNRTRIISLEG